MPYFTRPGFKLKEKGATNLGTDELLAILFGVGIRPDRKKGIFGESAIDLSNRLLKKYDLDKLVSCTLKQLTNEFKGDEVKALKILSLFELVKRYNKKMSGGFKYRNITSALDVFNMFKDDFQHEKQEKFMVLLLDTKNNILNIDMKEVTKGLLNSSLAHPREIFKKAIKESANSIILVHNHPSGDPTPSSEDIEITEKLTEAGKMLGIKVLDHVIISKKGYNNIPIKYV